MKDYFLLLLCLSFLVSAKNGQPNLELWNKHIKPLYYSITDSEDQAAKTALQLLPAGQFITGNRDLTKPTVFAISLEKEPQAGKPLDVFTIRPGKTLYIRIGLPAEKQKLKETLKDILGVLSVEKKDYIFGGQVGPLLGLRGITERGYSLKNNTRERDITPGSVIYKPAK